MKLGFQTAVASVFGLVFFGLALFLPAGTFNYWQAWVFIAVYQRRHGGAQHVSGR